ncbi:MULTISPECIES: HAD family phosphatase [Clostridium]|uniref:HAD-IA family hydrolase n=7 Tax=Clostridium perfringens TaxID=1502 RepID=A0AAW9IV17_CLOPF|nr:HAD family phosphatase [Clostridium perfringens]MDZ5034078.1 HAD-IA family hydrolase [Clostridium perfringens]MDZ7542540.1 HAD-IA family hydrolase [Clostridium perfringens]
MDNIQAVIFDLDGTLIDSMGIWAQIDEEYLSKFGYNVPDNLQEKITHLTLTETAIYFKNNFNIDSSIEDIISTWHEMAFYHYSNTIKLKDGVVEYLTLLKQKGVKIALATSNSIPLLEVTLKRNNIYHFFDSITTTEEVKKSKDNPDIYLLSAKKLNVDPNKCLVFEDIVQAVKGAKLAGMKVFAIYDKASENQKKALINIADKYILSFNELL